MSLHFGEANIALRDAIRRVVAGTTDSVKFRPHAQDMMDQRGFDHADVFTCLTKGMAYGPEIQHNQLRANVVYRGRQIRVVVGGLDDVGEDWSLLKKITVVTVLEAP